ncbi:DUF2164 domain-containing protein [Roseibium sp. RKSG952]|uniref:DUF2164 domain-containing protein n=1 Tax=Roseibium sp. RKSG952 TaxID=2529384 RepID=UPI0013CC77C8|nr:DUF2164 domain-containing protein [Roseibium sp. RKSG952]
MSDLQLDRKQRQALAQELRRFLEDELDTEIGNMDAERLVDFLTESFAPEFYNLGVRDAHALLTSRVEDMADAFYGLEKPLRRRR